MVRHVLIDGKTQDDSGFLNAPGTSSLASIIYVYIYIYMYMYIHTNIHYMYNVNTYYEMHLCILHVYTVYSNIYIISHLQNLDLVVDCVRMCQENHNGLIGDRLDTMVRKPHLIYFFGPSRFCPPVLGQKPLGICRVPKSHWAQLGTVMGL